MWIEKFHGVHAKVEEIGHPRVDQLVSPEAVFLDREGHLPVTDPHPGQIRLVIVKVAVTGRLLGLAGPEIQVVESVDGMTGQN
jgi:hypothetical protein